MPLFSNKACKIIFAFTDTYERNGGLNPKVCRQAFGQQTKYTSANQTVVGKGHMEQNIGYERWVKDAVFSIKLAVHMKKRRMA
ncbi:hypothetical protein Y1Q_0001083 [Alligator mississippiensis]|uniref:Uncharacterized protein n=1 Tax=Alligator mississippiensis TaxID=8496 RepID=A0A151NEX5_ALLMI|nr:hypothetical protein Y1Q_0001083 [Alligator mississippiensis]